MSSLKPHSPFDCIIKEITAFNILIFSRCSIEFSKYLGLFELKTSSLLRSSMSIIAL